MEEEEENKQKKKKELTEALHRNKYHFLFVYVCNNHTMYQCHWQNKLHDT